MSLSNYPEIISHTGKGERCLLTYLWIHNWRACVSSRTEVLGNTHSLCTFPISHLIQSICDNCEGKHSTKNAFSPLRRNRGTLGTKSKLTEMEHTEAACTYKLKWEHGSIPNTRHQIFAGGTWTRDIKRRQAGRPLMVRPCEASGNPLFGPRHKRETVGPLLYRMEMIEMIPKNLQL